MSLWLLFWFYKPLIHPTYISRHAGLLFSPSTVHLKYFPVWFEYVSIVNDHTQRVCGALSSVKQEDRRTVYPAVSWLRLTLFVCQPWQLTAHRGLKVNAYSPQIQTQVVIQVRKAGWLCAFQCANGCQRESERVAVSFPTCCQMYPSVCVSIKQHNCWYCLKSDICYFVSEELTVHVQFAGW